MAGRRRGGGCGACGCLLFIVLILVVAWAALVPFGLLQRLGLRQSAAERMLAGPPDEAAAAQLLAGVKAAGLSTKGVRLYVMPLTGSEERVAIAVLDAAQGFGTDVPDQDMVLRYLDRLAAGDTMDRLGIARVAVTYQDKEGTALMTLTGATDDIQSFASGRLSQDEFLNRLHANFDLGWFLKEVQSGLD